MARCPSLSARSMCSRHISILVLATLFFGLSSYILPCAARVERTYTLGEVVIAERLITMQDMQADCKKRTNGTLAIADTAKKDAEIARFVYDYWYGTGNDYTYTPIGGMMVSNRPDGQPPQLITEARWCWLYGDELCGPNNETLIGSYRGNEFVTVEGRYSNWKEGCPVFTPNSRRFIGINIKNGVWAPISFEHSISTICVVEKRTTNTEVPTVNITDPTDPPKKSLWWIALIVAAVVLVLVIVIVCVVCRCCCGAGAPVEEEYKPEYDDCLSSVRDVRSNRSLVSEGGSMRSMGSRRSSAYSASQSFHQDDVEEHESYGDRCASQGRSAASYYY